MEHNVKVWFIGRLARESEQHVVSDYNNVNPPLSRPPSDVSAAFGSAIPYAQGGSSSSSGFDQNFLDRTAYATPTGNASQSAYSSTTQPVAHYATGSFQSSAYHPQYRQPNYTDGKAWQQQSGQDHANAQYRGYSNRVGYLPNPPGDQPGNHDSNPNYYPNYYISKDPY